MKPLESLNKQEIIELARDYQREAKLSFIIGGLVCFLGGLSLGLIIGVDLL